MCCSVATKLPVVVLQISEEEMETIDTCGQPSLAKLWQMHCASLPITPSATRGCKVNEFPTYTSQAGLTN